MNVSILFYTVIVSRQGFGTDLRKRTTSEVENGISDLSEACRCKQEGQLWRLLPTVTELNKHAFDEIDEEVSRT